MKTWEVIKALVENPKLKFIDELRCVVGICPDTGRVMWLNDGRKENFIIFSNAPGNVDNLHIEWELVREPVDFITAIDSGKRIRPGDYPGFCSIDYWFEQGFVTKQRVKGKWYIE